jgi:hypothetical protein
LQLGDHVGPYRRRLRRLAERADRDPHRRHDGWGGSRARTPGYDGGEQEPESGSSNAKNHLRQSNVSFCCGRSNEMRVGGRAPPAQDEGVAAHPLPHPRPSAASVVIPFARADLPRLLLHQHSLGARAS